MIGSAVLDGFDCGNEALSRFLLRFAFQNQQANASQTYLGLAEDKLAGFYTLVVGEVTMEDAPERVKKGLARHPSPLMLLARMGVSTEYQGQGVGKGLLKDAMQMCLCWLLMSCASAAMPTVDNGSKPAGALPLGIARESETSIPTSELRVDCGQIEQMADGALSLQDACVRATVGQTPHRGAVLSFSYFGPSEHEVSLASGEWRRQIGIRLRAHDTCNGVYVMWHLAPRAGIFVSVKSNPDLRTHAQCADHGYIFLPPQRASAPTVRIGERHTLEARIEGHYLEVMADGKLIWEGDLPGQAFLLDGPVGIRSDNGRFHATLSTMD